MNNYKFINISKIKNVCFKTLKLMIVSAGLILFVLYLAYLVGNAPKVLKFQNPIILRSPIILEKRPDPIQILGLNTAQAQEITQALIWSDRGVVKSKLTDTEKYICELFGKECKTAIAIAKAESKMNCLEIGDRNLEPMSYGLFQIRSFNGRPVNKDLLDCKTNIDTAFKIYQEQGFGPWSTYKNGAYKKYLK